MPIERNDVTRALLFLVSLGGFLGALMLGLYLKEFWPIFVAFAALVLPLFVAGVRGSSREAKDGRPDPSKRRPWLAVSPLTAAVAFLLPGIAAAVAGVYLLTVGQEVWGVLLLVLVAPLGLLSWWGLR
jgi:hypothetical protein